MSFQSREAVGTENVIPLFSSVELDYEEDFFSDESFEIEDEDEDEVVMKTTESKRLIVSENQFPDQSMYILDEQLKGIRDRLERLKFFLSDLDDLLPS